MILASHVIPIAISYPFFQVPRARRIPVRRASAAAREAQVGAVQVLQTENGGLSSKKCAFMWFTNINLHFLVENISISQFFQAVSRRNDGIHWV